VQPRQTADLQAARRAQLAESSRQAYNQTLDARIDRQIEIEHQNIIGNHYFAAASSECLDLYRDGHFISTVMMTQAVNEGILKFVAGRNDVPRQKCPRLIEELRSKAIISADCARASTRIWESFRNDVHHMNPGVVKVPFPELAKQNLQDLAVVENDVFGVDIKEGNLVPKKPKHWDIQQDGTVPVFLRMGT
jgi:hypothetical protein